MNSLVEIIHVKRNLEYIYIYIYITLISHHYYKGFMHIDSVNKKGDKIPLFSVVPDPLTKNRFIFLYKMFVCNNLWQEIYIISYRRIFLLEATSSKTLRKSWVWDGLRNRFYIK